MMEVLTMVTFFVCGILPLLYLFLVLQVHALHKSKNQSIAGVVVS